MEASSEIRDNKFIYNGIHNNIFPDRFKGEKKLRIELEYRGRKYIKQYNKNEKINLPDDLGIKNKNWWKKSWVQVLFIIGTIASIIGLYFFFKINAGKI